MKKLHRFLYIATIALVISAIAMFVAACGGTTEPEAPKQYTLTFKLDENTDYDSYTGVAGSEVKRTKADPTNATARFEGWSASPDGEIVAIPTIMPEADQTYYAVFARYYNIKLNVGDGKLSVSDRLESKANQNIYSIVKDIIAPVAPNNSKFDGWYYNNVKLTEASAEVMPAKNIALDAKYSIGYTVNVHVQKSFGSDVYDEDDEKRIAGTGIVDSAIRESEFPELDGYEINDEKSGDTAAFVLNSTSNTFDIYYRKIGYNVSFVANAPAENLTVVGDAINEQWGYDDVHTMPKCPFTISGYRFSYWSTNPDGSENKYYVDDEHSVTSTTMMYAIWVRGYANAVFASLDRVYIDGDVAYLERTHSDELVGKYDAKTETFSFKDDNDKDIISGKVYPDSNRFVYYFKKSYNLCINNVGGDSYGSTIKSDITLEVAENGNAVYKDGANVTNGTYAYDDVAEALKFTPETNAKAFYFRLVEVINEATGLPAEVFEIRGEEYGTWRSMNANSDIDYTYNVILDGYGDAQMVALSLDSNLSPRLVAITNGVYKYTDESTADKQEITVRFANGEKVDEFTCLLLKGDYGTDQNKNTIDKVYVKKSKITTVYAMPESGADVNTETADKFELDGYGVFANSAKHYKGESEQVGKYFLDVDTSQLIFTPASGDKVAYELRVSMDEEDDENEGEDEVNVKDNIYLYLPDPASEICGVYYIDGLEDIAGKDKVRFYKFYIYGDGSARFKAAQLYQHFVYGNIYLNYTEVVSGTYTEDEDNIGTYHFIADDDFDRNTITTVRRYYEEVFGRSLDISHFLNFKFQLTPNTNTGAATDLADAYEVAPIELVYDGKTYSLDGYGNAKCGVVSLNKNYTVGKNGEIEYIQLYWDEIVDSKVVSKSQLYIKAYDEFLMVDKTYRAYNTVGVIPVIYVLNGGATAVLGYIHGSAVIAYAKGNIEWESADKYGKLYNIVLTNDDADFLFERFGTSFRFGISTVETASDSVDVFYIYDSNSVNSDGICTISGADGELIIDRKNFEAEYKTSDGKNSIKSKFTFVKDVITITEKVDDNTSVTHSFRLVYNDEKTEIVSFVKVADYSGKWKNVSDPDSYIVLTGNPNGKAYDGKYVVTTEEDGVKEYTGTYVRTSAVDVAEFIFTYYTDDNPTSKVDMKFAVGNSNGLPIFKTYGIALDARVYNSFDSSDDEYIGTIKSDGYATPMYVSADEQIMYSGTVTSFEPQNELLSKYDVIYSFTSGSTTFCFVLADGKAYRLDATFRAENQGHFTAASDSYKITLVEPEKDITVTSITTDGMGNVLIAAADGKTYKMLYGAYNSSTFMFVQKDKDDNNTRVAFFRMTVNLKDKTGTVTVQDAKIALPFIGEKHAVLLSDGFGTANYVDGNGCLHIGTYTRIDGTELVAFVYNEGVERTLYFKIDEEHKTFTVISYDDPSIPHEETQP